MAIAGQIVLFKFPQTDLTVGKLRPALLIKLLSNGYDDYFLESDRFSVGDHFVKWRSPNSKSSKIAK